MESKNQVRVRIDPNDYEGRIYLGKEFVVSGEPRIICGTMCVALNNIDGSRFSAAYDLSMLQPVNNGESK